MKIFIKNLKLSYLTLFFLMIMIPLFFIQCKNSKKAKQENAGNKDTTELTTDNKVKKEKPKLIYDDKGNIIERHAYSYRKKDGSIRSKDSYYYKRDERGNVTEEIKESYSPGGELKFKNVNYYSYDDKDRKIEQKFFSYDGEGNLKRKARNTFKYNENGYLIEDLGYFDDGSIKSKIILDPAETGALRSEEYIHYNKDGSKKDHKKYYYSQYGLQKTVDLMEK